MPELAASGWKADALGADAARRLSRLYADGGEVLDARARDLRSLLVANYVRMRSDEPALVLCVPCTAFDDFLAFEPVRQLLSCAEAAVLPLLVLPDAVAQEAAIQRAARADMSRLLYFLDASAVPAEEACSALRPLGHVVVLNDALLWPDADVRAVVAQRAAAAGRLEGFMTTLASSGSVVSVGLPLLDRLQGVARPEPMVSLAIVPQARVWFDLGAGPVSIGRVDHEPAAVAGELEPERVTCFANRGGAGNEFVLGFALGHGCRAALAEDLPFAASPGTSLVWGVLRGSDRVVQAAREAGRSFLYADHAYFDRGHLRNYRVILNAHATTRLRRCPPDRLRRLGVVPRPWSRAGRHVLVCPPTEYFLQAHGCPNWLTNTLSTLRRHTDRPIVVREKPKPGEAAHTLEQDLQDCHAVVAHSSNVAVEAAVLGVPVFAEPECAAIAVGCSDYRLIEQPRRPDRELWLANLAWTQFSFEEVLEGRVLPLIAEYVAMDPVA